MLYLYSAIARSVDESQDMLKKKNYLLKSVTSEPDDNNNNNNNFIGIPIYRWYYLKK